MNKQTIVKLTNRVSIVAIILLLYWVFIFTISMIFGFKVFRENLTQSFYFSIMGILAILAGAVIVNIMFNMTIISETFKARTGEPAIQEPVKKKKPLLIWIFALSFPLIGLLLYIGDVRTSGKKERHLVKSAKYLIENNSKDLDSLADYTFDSVYVNRSARLLKLLSKQDESFPSMQVIQQDQIDQRNVFLRFGGWTSWEHNNDKTDYIYSCSAEERDYLGSVFQANNTNHRFSASDGSYELYYPVKTPRGLSVLYFTDHQRYGKFGS